VYDCKDLFLSHYDNSSWPSHTAYIPYSGYTDLNGVTLTQQGIDYTFYDHIDGYGLYIEITEPLECSMNSRDLVERLFNQSFGVNWFAFEEFVKATDAVIDCTGDECVVIFGKEVKTC
jgi:hypothetical protein